MNSQEYRNLQEAYLDVYQEVDEATAMSKRGLDEPAIRNQIASKTRGGSFADKATALANKETYGDKKKKEGREKLARTQRGTFRDTNSSSPGLRGYGHQSSDPAVKAKQAARGAQRGSAALTPNERKQLNMESYDLFDYIMEYLITEGYADTNENALVIMANMSEEWRESIVEDAAYNTLKGFGYPGALVSVGLNKLSGGKIAKPDQPTVKSTPTPKAPTVSSSGGAGGKVTVDKQYPATLNKERGMKSTGETGTEYFTPNIRGTNITDFDKAQYKNTYTNTYKDIPARQSTKNPQSHLSRTGVPRVHSRTASYGIDD